MISEVVSIQWESSDNTTAKARVKLEGFGDDVFDYYVGASDTTPHGKALWDSIQSGNAIVSPFVESLDVDKNIKMAELNSFVSEAINQGVNELGVKISLDQTTIGYLASMAYLNNVDNVIHDSEDIYHTNLTNADVVQILQSAVTKYHNLISYKKTKELEIQSATDKSELDLIIIGLDF